MKNFRKTLAHLWADVQACLYLPYEPWTVVVLKIQGHIIIVSITLLISYALYSQLIFSLNFDSLLVVIACMMKNGEKNKEGKLATEGV